MLENILCKRDYDTSKKSHVKIGGTFDIVYFPKSVSEVFEIVNYLNKKNLDYFVLGNLSNVLIRDGRIETIGISLKYLKNIKIMGEKIEVGAGALMPTLATSLLKKGYLGFEGLVGIPGTVGGGIYMNASSYGSCISDFIESITYITKNGSIETISKRECDFKWRNSIFRSGDYKDAIIISCLLSNLKKTDKQEKSSTENVDMVKLLRGSYQEKKYPNLGSTFSTRNIYKDIFQDNRLDKIAEIMIRIISKLTTDRHKTYSNLIRKYTVISRGIPDSLSENISEFTLNCFVNKGLSYNEFKGNIEEFRKVTNIKTELEIEIVDEIK
ncbi:UDP-N-acetylenolpyruvoylglucosamine reductase [Vibrio nigripulchritudo ATCC 27043]|uniref:UDP-N-acetylmuramate dehydrogenase n=1 Tax=Vibrio nigripulchritudo TaxID=28173 RepID=UPI00021C18A0|nr:FAD-binding protein [Vibrio nigripulchritudo]EGU56694.1 UDP-N-acetylenolpyruvoylglucosamine reductase [Vibrio nigripulchritudo ATCC 27043]